MTILTIKLITIYFLTIFLNFASLNLSKECNLPGFKEHRCFQNGILICTKANIFIACIDARMIKAFSSSYMNAYVLETELFRKILFRYVNPCFYNIFDQINMTFADELGIYQSTTDLNSTSDLIFGEHLLLRRLARKNESKLVKSFNEHFLKNAENNTLNMAFIFTDLMHDDDESDFLYYGVNKSNQMSQIVNQADILMHFLIFTQENELAYSKRLEWASGRVPLMKKTNHKVGLTFMSNTDFNEFNTTGKLNSTICDQIQTLKNNCKQDPQSMQIRTIIGIFSIFLMFVLVLIVCFIKRISRTKRFIDNILNQTANNSLLQVADETPQLKKIKSIKDVNRLKFPCHEKKYEFKIKDLIAKGVIGAGQNVVTKFVHRPSRQRLAIKFLSIPISRLDGQDPSNRQRFKKVEQEIENSKIISDCPNIVKFYGFCVHELQVLLCMELMDLSLKDLFMKVHEKSLTFSEKMIGYITVSIIDAMAFCKSKGIIHRDIKPPNILINYTGQIKLCDFGESRILEDSLASTYVGTMAYWPPERFRFQSLDSREYKYDIRSDVWSFGITLLEVILGMKPFIHPNSDADIADTFVFITRIASFDFKKLIDETIQGKYSPELCEMLNSCLEKVENRYNINQLLTGNFYLEYKKSCCQQEISQCLSQYT